VPLYDVTSSEKLKELVIDPLLPVVKKQHIKPGTHINAIGADAKGKQELEADLLRNGKIIVDNIEQASHSGEINVPLSQGEIKIEDVYGTLGEVVVNMKKRRENSEEITIFDSTGSYRGYNLC
jgi:alanine dehydrogenase